MVLSYWTRKGVYNINDLIAKKIAANTSTGVNSAALAANNQRKAAIIKASSSVMVKNRAAAIEAAQGLAQQISAQRAAAATTSARQNAVNMSNMYLSVVGSGSTQGNVQSSLKTLGTKSKKASWQEALDSVRISRGLAASENPKYAVKEQYIDELVINTPSISSIPSTSKTNNQLVGKTTAASKSTGKTSNSSKGNTTSYYDVDSSLASIYKQATAAGVSVSKPSKYGSTITDAKKAQSIIDEYTAKVNKAINAKNAASASASKASSETVYDVSSQYNEIYNSGKNYGVTIAKPTQTQFKTQAAAQAALDSYVSQVNKALEKAPAPTYTNIDPQKTSGYAYTVTLSHAQQNELIRRNQTRKQQGKAELSEFAFRQEKGISTETTQGSYVKPKLTNKSYSSAGTGSKTVKAVKDEGQNSRQVARIGSGDVKLAQVKAASKATSNNNKATVLTAAQTKQIKAAAAEKKLQASARASADAIKAKQLAKDARAEAAAKSKQLAAARAQVKKTASTASKTALKKDVKALEKAATAARNASKVANSNAKATANLAAATKKAATLSASPTLSAKRASEASNAVKRAEASVKKTSLAASKAGVQDHTGQILLKDGTWISPIQKSSSRGVGEKNVKIFGTTSEYQKQLAEEYKDKLAGKSTKHSLNPVYAKALAETKQAKINEAAEAKKLAAAYVPVLAATGEVINAIQSKSLSGTGEAGVRVLKLDKAGNITAASKSAKEYYDEAKLYNQKVKTADDEATTIDKLSITAKTDSATAKLIKNARAYQLAHTPNAKKMSLQLEYAGLDGELSAPVAKSTFKTVKQLETENRINKALAEARKINPKGSKEYFEGVANSARRNSMTTKEVMAEDYTNAEKAVAKNIAIPVVNEFLKVTEVRDRALDRIKLSKTDAAGNRINYTAKQAHRDIINKNIVLSGYNKFLNSEVEEIKTRPLKYGAELVAISATAGVLGAGVGGLKAVTKLGGSKASAKILSKTAKSSKVVKIVGKTASKASSLAGKHAVDAGMILIPSAAAYSGFRDTFSSSDYKKLSDVETDAVKVDYIAGLFEAGKEMAVGWQPFSKGAAFGEAAASKRLTSNSLKSFKVKPTATKKPTEITLEENIDGGLVAKTYASKADIQKARSKNASKMKARHKNNIKASGKKPLNVTLEKNIEGDLVTKTYATKTDILNAKSKNASKMKARHKNNLNASGKKLLNVTLEKNIEGDLVTKTYATKIDILNAKSKNASKMKARHKNNLNASGKKLLNVTLEKNVEGDLVTKTYATRAEIQKARSTTVKKPALKTTVKSKAQGLLKKRKEVTLEKDVEGQIVLKQYVPKSQIDASLKKSNKLLKNRTKKLHVKLLSATDDLKALSNVEKPTRRYLTSLEKQVIERPRTKLASTIRLKSAKKAAGTKKKGTTSKRVLTAAEKRVIDSPRIKATSIMKAKRTLKASSTVKKAPVKKSHDRKIADNGRFYREREISKDAPVIDLSKDLIFDDSAVLTQVQKNIRKVEKPLNKVEKPLKIEKSFKTVDEVLKSRKFSHGGSGSDREVSAGRGQVQLMKMMPQQELMMEKPLAQVKHSVKSTRGNRKLSVSEKRVVASPKLKAVSLTKVKHELKPVLKSSNKIKIKQAVPEKIKVQKKQFRPHQLLQITELGSQQQVLVDRQKQKEKSKTRMMSKIGAVEGVVSSVKSLEKVIDTLKTPQRMRYTDHTKPVTAEKVKQINHSPVKPTQITKQVSALEEIVTPTTKQIVPPTMKPVITPITKPIITPVITPIIKEITLIENLVDWPQEGIGDYMKTRTRYNPLILNKKHKKTYTAVEKKTNRAKMHRKIKNVLGSMDTFLGGSVAKPMKKPTKRGKK